MALHVERQVIAPREAPLADDALEGFGPRVFPVVPGQLIRPGEPPLALRPLAGVGLLTWKNGNGGSWISKILK